MTALKQRRGISQRRQRRAGLVRSHRPSRSRVSARTGTTSRQTPQWQVLEERVGGVVKAQYVWSPVYVDAMILRDRDADNNTGNGLEERLWVMQDANFNVTGLVNGSGTVVERYAYDPFGGVTYLNGSWTGIGSTAYGWAHGHQGLRLDVAGYDNRGRIYDPVLGRFRNMDPIRYDSSDVNLYRYVSNNPVLLLDPYGLHFIQVTAGLGDASGASDFRRGPGQTSLGKLFVDYDFSSNDNEIKFASPPNITTVGPGIFSTSKAFNATNLQAAHYTTIGDGNKNACGKCKSVSLTIAVSDSAIEMKPKADNLEVPIIIPKKSVVIIVSFQVCPEANDQFSINKETISHKSANWGSANARRLDEPMLGGFKMRDAYFWLAKVTSTDPTSKNPKMTDVDKVEHYFETTS